MARNWGRAGTVLALSGALVAPMAVTAVADDLAGEQPEVAVQELDLSGVVAAEVAALPDEAPLPAEELDSTESDLDAAVADAEAGATDAAAASDAVIRTTAAVDPGAADGDRTADVPAATTAPDAGTDPDAGAGTDVGPGTEPAPTASPSPDPAPDAEPADPGPTPEPSPAPTEQPPAPDVLTRELDTAPYSVLGVTWDADPDLAEVVIRYRYRTAGEWTDWEAAGGSDIGPDADGADATGARGATDPIVALHADGLQIWAEAGSGTVRGLKAVLIDPGEDPAPVVADVHPAASTPGGAAAITTAAYRTDDDGTVLPAASHPAPAIISRAAWGADESLRTCQSDVSTQMVSAAVHHTASSNDYTAADVPGLLRGFYAYHTRPEASGGRGWCDIGYNMLIDKFGRVFEGRAGSIDQTVIGVHTGGFNSRTFGISAIGEYGSAGASSAMLEAFAQTIAWKFSQLRVRGNATVSMVSGGGATRFPAGTVVTFPTIYAHRDSNTTSCPGQNLYNSLGWIRARVSQLVDTGVNASPYGNWESSTAQGSTLNVRGWMHDPDSRGSIQVAVSVNGTRTVVTADQPRADVQAAIATAGPRHGFQAAVPLTATRNVVCLWGMNVGGGYDTTSGCRVVTVSSSPPQGQLEAATGRGGAITVTGWAVDRDTTSPVGIAVHVDGRGYWTTTQLARPDVQRAIAGAGPNQGYSLTVPAASGSTHQVCVTAVNTPTGPNTSLGCRTVGVDAAVPRGNMEAVTGSGGRLTVTGWAADADTTAPVGVAVYVDGRGYWTTTSLARPDVQRAVAGAGPHQGFSLTVPAASGTTHQVCVVVVNTPRGPNTSLGCRSAGVDTSAPVGNFEGVSGGRSTLSVVGWAHDADTTAPVGLAVYVDGRGYWTTTSLARPDVAAAVRGAGPNRGFGLTVAAAPGRHTVCVVASNSPAGPATSLGCRVATAS